MRLIWMNNGVAPHEHGSSILLRPMLAKVEGNFQRGVA